MHTMHTENTCRTPTKKKCILRCCEPFKQGVPVSRRGSWGSKSERSRNRSHKRASQSPGGQSESDESNPICPICLICPIAFAFCSAFCRSGGLGTRTEQGKCEVVRHLRHWDIGVLWVLNSFDMCLAFFTRPSLRVAEDALNLWFSMSGWGIRRAVFSSGGRVVGHWGKKQWRIEACPFFGSCLHMFARDSCHFNQVLIS